MRLWLECLSDDRQVRTNMYADNVDDNDGYEDGDADGVQWRHTSVIAFQSTGHLDLCSKSVSSPISWNVYQGLVDSPCNGQWYVFHDTKPSPFQWRYNGRDDVSNHQCLDCLLNHLFKRRKKSSKLRVTDR